MVSCVAPRGIITINSSPLSIVSKLLNFLFLSSRDLLEKKSAQWDENTVRNLKLNETKAREELREAKNGLRKETELKDLKDQIKGKITQFQGLKTCN